MNCDQYKRFDGDVVLIPVKLTTKGYIFLVASLLAGAMLPVALKFATNVNMVGFLALSYLIAIPFASLLVVMTKRQERFKSYVRDRKKLALIVLIGLLFYVPSGFILLYAEHFISASFATAVYRTWPLLMLPMVPYFLKERLSRYQALALVLGLLGIYIALTNGTFMFSGGNQYLQVVALVAVGAFSYGLASLLIKKYLVEIESAVLIFNIALFLLFGSIFIATGAQLTLGFYDVIALVYLAVCVNVIGFYGYFYALRALKTTFATNAYLLSPFLTFLFAYLLLGESIQLIYITIALLVTVGLVIQKLDSIGGSYAKNASSDSDLFIFDLTPAFVKEESIEIVRAIENGGKVLGIKLDRIHEAKVRRIAATHHSPRVYVGLGSFKREVSDFISETMEKAEDEVVVVCAGAAEESEELLNYINGEVNSG